MARTIRVHDKSVVVILSKAEAKAILRGIESNYFQNTKQLARIINEIQNALAFAGAR